MFSTRVFPALFLLFPLLLSTPTRISAQLRFNEAAAERDLRHQTPEWLALAPHLPDPATASPELLSTAGDVLRARRMPEDALDFYEAAVRRGANQAALFNRIGITELELHRTALARSSFKQAVALKTKDGEGWNNLGAAEYIAGNYRAAIQNYLRAVKLNKKMAVFHSNLGTAYFETKDFESATKQFAIAMSLDPNVFLRGGAGGVQAHVLSPADHGRFCFELARLAARHHDDEAVLHWLAQASETGYDIHYQMSTDRAFDSYSKDKRVLLIMKNTRAMRAGQIASSGPAPTLPAESPKLD